MYCTVLTGTGGGDGENKNARININVYIYTWAEEESLAFLAAFPAAEGSTEGGGGGANTWSVELAVLVVFCQNETKRNETEQNTIRT